MAHFAEICNGVVRQVIVVANSDCADKEFPESEPIGQAFIASLGINGEWLQTSYNNNFRGKFCNMGDTWNGTDFVAQETPEPPVEE